MVCLLRDVKPVKPKSAKLNVLTRCGKRFVVKAPKEAVRDLPVTVWACDVTCDDCLRP